MFRNIAIVILWTVIGVYLASLWSSGRQIAERIAETRTHYNWLGEEVTIGVLGVGVVLTMLLRGRKKSKDDD